MSEEEDGRGDATRTSRRIPLQANRRSSGQRGGTGLNKNDDEAEKSARRAHRRSSGFIRGNKDHLADEEDTTSQDHDMDDYGEPAAKKTKGKGEVAGRVSETQGKGNKIAARPRISVVNRPVTSAPTTAASATMVAGATVSGNSSVAALGDISNTPGQVPRKVMDDNFEEWMKMATDNVSNPCPGLGY
jgi:hypothetical protein